MTAEREGLVAEIAAHAPTYTEYAIDPTATFYCKPCSDAAGDWVTWTPEHVADALADLLAARDRRARAEALREAADFCEPVIADALGVLRNDFADGWRRASGQFLAELRDQADRIEADA